MAKSFAALEAQVHKLNSAMAATVATSAAVDPAGYARMAQIMNANANTFRNAALSTKQFEVHQLRLNSATDEYIKKLNKQKISFREWRKEMDLSRRAYREQLAMQSMVVRKGMTTIGGRQTVDVIVPQQAHKDLDTLGNRIGWVREQVRSASTQMVNWGKNTQWAGRQLMVGFTMPVLALGAATGVLAYQVDKQMVRIQKVYDTTADANSKNAEDQIAVEKELIQVREDSMQTAIKAAREYGVAGTDTLEIQADLAATGLKGQRLQQTTNEIMRIATLGEMEHADALNASIALQSVFKMSTDELTESFNYMNAVENATSLQLADFAKAIPIAAAPVKQFGGDIKELGVLLTAMRENGIQATQGANAIKAAMQRLGRPSKQIREEFEAYTGANIQDIFDQSEGLVDLFQRLNEVTRDLDNKTQTKVFAGLFGTYQVTRMSAMLKGMEDLENGVGQVSDAFKLGKGDAQEWADAADREVKRMAESASGQFKIALESLKLEMSEMGGPFIEIAADVLKVIGNIAKAFNDMPDPAKKFAAYAMIAGALIGPVIMLAGLFGNLIGNLMKFGVAITGVLGKMEILDRDSRAAQLAAKLAASGFQYEASAVEKLRHELNLLVQSQKAANRQSMALIASDVMAANPGMTRSQAYRQMADARRATLIAEGRMDPTTGASIKQVAADTADVAKQSEKASRSWRKVGTHVGVAASGLAIMAMMGDGNVSKFGQMVFYAMLLGPALMAVVQGAALLGPLLVTGAKALALNASVATFLLRTEVARLGVIGATTAAARGLAAVMMSTLGIASLAGGALLGGLWLLKKHHDANEKIKQQQVDQAKALESQNAILTKSLEIQVKKAKELKTITASTAPGEKTTSDLADELVSTKAGKDLVSMYANASEAEQATIAAKKYIDVLRAAGGNSMKARQQIEAMFIAAGDGALEAERKSREVLNTIGSMASSTDVRNVWTEMFTLGIGESDEAIHERAKGLGEMLANELASVDRGLARENVFKNFYNSVNDAWDNMMGDLPSNVQDTFKHLNITGGAELRNLMQNWQNMTRDEKMSFFNVDESGLRELEQAYGVAMSYIGKEVDALGHTEAEIVKTLADQLDIKEEITTLAELHATKEWKLQTATKAQAKQYYRVAAAAIAATNAAAGLFGETEHTTEELQLAELNTWRVALGMRETGNLADGFGRATKDINGNVIDWKNNQDGVNDELREGIRLSARQKAILESIEIGDVTDQLKGAMSSYQEGIADATMRTFESNMDSAISGMESRHEAAIEGQERRQDRAMERFDNHWENRIEKAEKFHDKRIEGVNKQIDAEKKADETRQRLFDAEMARLDRLNQMSNRNIDFNVALNAGNFDEAAKIRNDAEADAAGWALGDAKDRADRKAEARTERLEKQVERLEKIKDNRINALKEIEEAERKALQRTHERRKKALKEDLDATLEAEKKKWDMQKKRLEDALDNFLGYTATSDKDLKKHMAQWEKRYGAFNLTTEGMFNATTKNIAKFLKDNLKESQREFANERDWQLSGAKIANSMLQGAFGMSTQDFKEFLATGIWPDGSKPPTVEEIKQKMAHETKAGRAKLKGDVYHTGGIVGKDKGGYAGFRPGHRDEVSATLLKGEGVLSRSAMEAIGDRKFHALNSGRFGTDEKGVGGGGTLAGAGLGFAGLMSALMARAVMSSITTGIQSGMAFGLARQAETMGIDGGYTGKAGTYGSLSLSPSQMKHAATIATVGKSMGMSQRDIQIGIMTAITESMLSIPTQAQSDRDSAGLFQQRPSMGWGSVEQVMDPVYASKKFFTELKKIEGRGNLAPWQAAQAVQRSAFSDGSNYRQYWDEAQSIFGSLTQNTTPGAQYAPGRGGWNRPSVRGYGWGNTHDYQVPIGTPLFAVSDGTIIESRAITSGGSPGNGLYPTPYRSYGETVAMRTASGDIFRWAHLNPGTRIGLGPVKGGTMIGRSGNTGNSSGPHVHMDVNGNYDALGWLRKHGIALKTGGYTMSDGLANLHKNEVVISPERTAKLYEGIDRFAEGGNAEYNVNMYITEPGATADEIADKAVIKIRRMQKRRPQSRKVSA